MAKVTILTPVYNNKHDIINAIKSVIKQTYKNWEMIVIDDCSTDGTYDLVAEFIKNSDHSHNIHLLRNDVNSGPFISLNNGILKSTGEYICRIDSDDIIVPEYFEICAEFLEKNPDIICVHTLSKRVNADYNPEKSKRREKYGEITLFYRKSVIDNIGYYDSVRFAADSEFRERLYHAYGRDKIMKIAKITYLAKVRHGSITRTKETRDRNVRGQYVRYYRRWHRKCLRRKKRGLYIPYPLTKRLFAADPIMLPPLNKPETANSNDAKPIIVIDESNNTVKI